MQNKTNGKMTLTITIAIACVVLTTVMFMQFKIVNQTDINELEVMREEELRSELANWKNKYQEAEKQREEMEQKLIEYNKSEASETEAEQLIKSELENVNIILGTTDVTGQGIVIKLEQSNDYDSGVITDENLNLIVNSLKEAGAEAISINENRIVNMTDIVSVSQNIIRVNQQRVILPYVIKAIGNPNYLESALMGNGGEADKLQKLGHDVTIEKEQNVLIPKYNKELTVKYMQ